MTFNSELIQLNLISGAAGSTPSSTPENIGLTTYVNNLAKASNGLELYIDYHSYSQLFMTRELCQLNLMPILILWRQSLWLHLHHRHH